MMTRLTRFTIYDRRNGEVHRSYQIDASVKSENKAIRESRVPGQFADTETCELSEDASREYVAVAKQ